jgi:ferritin-like metal-binding protein YciE
VGLFTNDIKTMNDLFVHQLQDIYYAEKQLVIALPKMAEKATDKQLKQGFLSHLDETRTHVQRLEQVFRMHGAEVKAVSCPAIDGIIKEADEVAGTLALRHHRRTTRVRGSFGAQSKVPGPRDRAV